MLELKVGTSRSVDDGQSDSKIRELSMQLADLERWPTYLKLHRVGFWLARRVQLSLLMELIEAGLPQPKGLGASDCKTELSGRNMPS